VAGLFLTFEGPEGVGKSTQVEMLRHALAEHDPLVVREPGGTALGERIRHLVLHARAMSPAAEMYLFMAARSELLAEHIQPALAAGRVVIADRYHDSTLAYQGGGRGVEVRWPESFPRPDLTFLLVLDAGQGLDRLRGRDRLESESLDFHRAVIAAYDRLSQAEPDRYVRLDASQSEAELHSQVMERVSSLLARTGVAR
jgi:dTMP kinase